MHTPQFLTKGTDHREKARLTKKCLSCSDHLKRNRMEHILGASNLFTPLWCRGRCNGKKWLQILALSSLETWWDTSLSYILWEKSVSNVYIPIPLRHSIVQRSFSEGVKTDFIKDILRCFYCYPFKQQEFVCKNAKILLLLKGLPEMDLHYF